MRYDHGEIEKKWQKYWKENQNVNNAIQHVIHVITKMENVHHVY